MIKESLFPNGGYSDSISSLSGFSQQEREIKEEIKNGMGLKFSKNIAERTSLLHGGIQFEKYPEISDPDILKIGKELNEDAELAPFRTEAYGLRQRSKLEIEESKSRLEQQRLENK
jgi:hypothetical protein